MNLTALAGWIDQLAILLLLVVLVQVMTHRLATAIVVVGCQGALLTAVAVILAVGVGSSHAIFGAVLTATVRMILVPLFLWAALNRVAVKVENQPVLPAAAMLVIGVVLTLVAYEVAGAYPLPGPIPSRHALPIAIALILIGMFLMIARRKALSQVIALVTIENGIALAALVATAGMPLAVELGLTFDLLVGVALMGVLAGRISQTFRSTDVDRLRELRG